MAPGAAERQCLPPRNARGEPPHSVTVTVVATSAGRGHGGKECRDPSCADRRIAVLQGRSTASPHPPDFTGRRPRTDSCQNSPEVPRKGSSLFIPHPGLSLQKLFLMSDLRLSCYFIKRKRAPFFMAFLFPGPSLSFDDLNGSG